MAQCNCPSQGDGPVRMVSHLAGCRFVEDLIDRSRCGDEADHRAPREPAHAEKALADTYRRQAGGLAAIEDAYADDSWRTDWV